ncbi:hypothetical protein F4811DRAFT_517391 [Daldinia bambusicola]|nr:hypothetical protein F4811DRAFT_517391 [Daldinia bambusicola]
MLNSEEVAEPAMDRYDTDESKTLSLEESVGKVVGETPESGKEDRVELLFGDLYDQLQMPDYQLHAYYRFKPPGNLYSPTQSEPWKLPLLRFPQQLDQPGLPLPYSTGLQYRNQRRQKRNVMNLSQYRSFPSSPISEPASLSSAYKATKPFGSPLSCWSRRISSPPQTPETSRTVFEQLRGIGGEVEEAEQVAYFITQEQCCELRQPQPLRPCHYTAAVLNMPGESFSLTPLLPQSGPAPQAHTEDDSLEPRATPVQQGRPQTPQMATCLQSNVADADIWYTPVENIQWPRTRRPHYFPVGFAHQGLRQPRRSLTVEPESGVDRAPLIRSTSVRRPMQRYSPIYRDAATQVDGLVAGQTNGAPPELDGRPDEQSIEQANGQRDEKVNKQPQLQGDTLLNGSPNGLPNGRQNGQPHRHPHTLSNRIPNFQNGSRDVPREGNRRTQQRQNGDDTARGDPPEQNSQSGRQRNRGRVPCGCTCSSNHGYNGRRNQTRSELSDYDLHDMIGELRTLSLRANAIGTRLRTMNR